MGYSAALDGVRAIAILAVLVFHVVPKGLRGGFTGVDVFFVLSGFLITSIILHDLRERSFSLREFYARRVQRLLPNVVVTVLVVVALWAALMPASAARLAASHAVWTLTNLSNVFIWNRLGGYWGEAAESAPLLHTWSLAIEEQFYLVFPTALVLLARWRRERVARWLIGATALSLVACLVATPRSPAGAFYMLPTRVWELLMGAALAALRTPLAAGAAPRPALDTRAQELAGGIGLLVVTVGFFTIGERGFPGAKALVPTVGTLLVLLAAIGENRVSRLLANPFMVWTGKLSYSLYLWHWPLIMLGRSEAELRGVSPTMGAVAGALAGIALSVAAYFAVEQPLRARGPGRGWRLATIAAGYAVVLGGASWSTSPSALADPPSAYDPPEFRGLLYAAGTLPRGDWNGAVRYRDVKFPSLAGRADDAWRTGGVLHPWGSGTPEVVVLGSSHALMYSGMVDRICEARGLSVSFLGVDETPPFFSATVNASFRTVEAARAFDAARRRFLEAWRPRVVFVIDRWDGRLDANGRFERELEAFLAEVSPLAGRVVLVSQVPVAAPGEAVNLREYQAWRERRTGRAAPLVADEGETRRQRAVAIFEAARARFPNVALIRPDEAFRDADGSIHWASGRTSYYADDDHLSEAGAERVRRLFEREIDEAQTAVVATKAAARAARHD